MEYSLPFFISCLVVLLTLFIHKEAWNWAPIGMAASTYWCLTHYLITDFVIGIESYNFCYLLFLYLIAKSHKAKKLRVIVRHLIILSMFLTSLSFCGVSLTLFTTYKSIGMQLVLVGLLFKLACVPFCFWLIDSYKQLPLCCINLDSSIKLFLILITLKFINTFPVLNKACIGFGIISVLVGGILPFRSKNIKEFFACLHVGHIGIVLISLSILTYYYFLSYVVCLIAFFYILHTNFTKFEFASFSELVRIKHKELLTIPSLAILGTPPFHMFFAKVALLQNISGYKLYLILLYFVLEIVFISVKLRYCFKPYIKATNT